jgi:hypothetical protein
MIAWIEVARQTLELTRFVKAATQGRMAKESP